MSYLLSCLSLFISTLALCNLICKDICNYCFYADDPIHLLPSSRPLSVQTKILFLCLNRIIQQESFPPPSSLPMLLLSLHPHYFVFPHQSIIWISLGFDIQARHKYCLVIPVIIFKINSVISFHLPVTLTPKIVIFPMWILYHSFLQP